MAFGTIKGGGKKGPTRVPSPSGRFPFVYGSRPSNMRSPTPKGITSIKPQAANTTAYGKPDKLPGFDQTGLTGES